MTSQCKKRVCSQCPKRHANKTKIFTLGNGEETVTSSPHGHHCEGRGGANREEQSAKGCGTLLYPEDYGNRATIRAAKFEIELCSRIDGTVGIGKE